MATGLNSSRLALPAQPPQSSFVLPSSPVRFGQHTQDEAARAPLPLLLYLREHCLCLRQPEGHVHGAVEVDGRGQFGTSLLPLARSPHTGCRDHGDSGPGGGACRVPRPGRGPADSARRRARGLAGHDAWQSRRAATGLTPPGSVCCSDGGSRAHAVSAGPPHFPGEEIGLPMEDRVSLNLLHDDRASATRPARA